MRVSKISTLTGNRTERDIEITDDQILRFKEGKELVQTIFPNLSADDREFLISGITPEEWKDAFGEEKED